MMVRVGGLLRLGIGLSVNAGITYFPCKKKLVQRNDWGRNWQFLSENKIETDK